MSATLVSFVLVLGVLVLVIASVIVLFSRHRHGMQRGVVSEGNGRTVAGELLPLSGCRARGSEYECEAEHDSEYDDEHEHEHEEVVRIAHV